GATGFGRHVQTPEAELAALGMQRRQLLRGEVKAVAGGLAGQHPRLQGHQRVFHKAVYRPLQQPVFLVELEIHGQLRWRKWRANYHGPAFHLLSLHGKFAIRRFWLPCSGFRECRPCARSSNATIPPALRPEPCCPPPRVRRRRSDDWTTTPPTVAKSRSAPWTTARPLATPRSPGSTSRARRARPSSSGWAPATASTRSPWRTCRTPASGPSSTRCRNTAS